MNFLVIDGRQDKINFFSQFNNNSYHKSLKASKNNNDQLSIELFDFFDENSINPSKLNNILVNQVPGKFYCIRTSWAVAKALSVTKRLNLYAFSGIDVKNDSYKNVINLFKKGELTKNLIKHIYSS